MRKNTNTIKPQKMKKTLYILLILFGTSIQSYGQVTPLSPLNNTANKTLIKSDTSNMSWFMLNDSLKMHIGDIETQIQVEEEMILIITTVNMVHSPTRWIDSTIVETLNFQPMYHSSYNDQRDMVLTFGEKITGYYFDKQTESNTQISETYNGSFFDSNFYPQLIRLLPLEENYSNTISIFDYNPNATIGVITATIIGTEETILNFNGTKRQVWKVKTTDDISNNSAFSTYYIDQSTRELLQQEVDFGGRKMIMELVE